MVGKMFQQGSYLRLRIHCEISRPKPNLLSYQGLYVRILTQMIFIFQHGVKRDFDLIGYQLSQNGVKTCVEIESG